MHVCAVALSSSRRRSVHAPATLHGDCSLVFFKGTTHMAHQAPSVEPDVRLPFSDLLRESIGTLKCFKLQNINDLCISDSTFQKWTKLVQAYKYESATL